MPSEPEVRAESPTPLVRPWPQVFASLTLATGSLVLSGLYSKLHWKALFVSGRLRECVDGASFTAAVRVLDSLWFVKIAAAALALGFAIWALVRPRPFVPSIVAVVFAALALLRAGLLE